MVYLTGDCHGDFRRFSTSIFPEQKEMTRNDFVIILGDFSGIWCGSKEEKYWLDWLNDKPFTTLFVDGNHECMHKDTDVLTNKGWVNIKEVYDSAEDYLIASVDCNNKITFSSPLSKIKSYSDKMVLINSPNFKQCVTPNHDIIVKGVKIKANELLNSDYRIEDFRYKIDNSESNGIGLGGDLIELLTAIVMDATIVDYNLKNKNSHKLRIQFHFKKLRKVAYIKCLLDRCSINYTERTYGDGEYFINIYSDNARYLYDKLKNKKEIPFEWREMNNKEFSYLLNALVNTDGVSATNNIVWITTSLNNLNIITEICVRNGYDINVINKGRCSGYTDNCLTQYQVSIGINKKLNHFVKCEMIDYYDDVYCFTMENGNLVTRYDMCPVVTGNCFDLLYTFPVVDFHGGKAHKIRDNIYHLMRGYVFDICDKKFFAFGGASSHDISDGILNPDDFRDKEEFKRRYKQWQKIGKEFRVKGISWWEEELPSEEEMKRGEQTLNENNYEVDYVITHCLPQDVASAIGFRGADCLTQYFSNLLFDGLKFNKWYCGHYHLEKQIFGKFNILYEKIIRIV